MRRMLPYWRPIAVKKEVPVSFEAAFLQQKVKHLRQSHVTSSRGMKPDRSKPDQPG